MQTFYTCKSITKYVSGVNQFDLSCKNICISSTRGAEKSASSPVARDHWEIFELIIKESGDKGSDGKGRKSEAPGKS